MIKRKRWYSLVIIFLAFACIYVLYQNSYSEFEPTLFDGKTFNKIKTDINFDKNLTFVLDYYKESYKKDNQGKILVKRTLLRDKELMWNYTEKVLDSIWLSSH